MQETWKLCKSDCQNRAVEGFIEKCVCVCVCVGVCVCTCSIVSDSLWPSGL